MISLPFKERSAVCSSSHMSLIPTTNHPLPQQEHRTTTGSKTIVTGMMGSKSYQVKSYFFLKCVNLNSAHPYHGAQSLPDYLLPGHQTRGVRCLEVLQDFTKNDATVVPTAGLPAVASCGEDGAVKLWPAEGWQSTDGGQVEMKIWQVPEPSETWICKNF